MGKYYSTTLQQGATGDEVKEWQNFLISQGMNIAADGIFGKDTRDATYTWQIKNGLTQDGIVGENTWSKAGYSALSTPTARPSNGAWDTSEKGSAAKKDYDDAKSAVNDYADFMFSDQEWLNTVKGNIENYGDFSYDLNGDALYQQYKDKYIQQGKLAMGDAIGQASAMTGGYGNSYAQSVGQQAYQGQLDNLNDIVPELYQMALDKHNMDLDNLYNQYGLLSSEYDREYGLHQDEYSKLLDQLGIAKDDYYSGEDRYYDNAWREYEADEEARRYEKEHNNTTYEPIQPDDTPPKKPEEKPIQDPGALSLPRADLERELNEIIKSATDKNKAKSEVKNYLRLALNDGVIDQATYNELISVYAPRGNTY